MHHLALLPVKLELTRHQLRLAQWQQLAGIAGVVPEIGQAQIIARVVDSMDTQRSAHAALLVIDGRHDDPDLRPRQGIVEPVDPRAHHRSGRQMEQDVDHPRQPQSRQRLGQSRTDAFEHLDFGE